MESKTKNVNMPQRVLSLIFFNPLSSTKDSFCFNPPPRPPSPHVQHYPTSLMWSEAGQVITSDANVLQLSSFLSVTGHEAPLAEKRSGMGSKIHMDQINLPSWILAPTISKNGS